MAKKQKQTKAQLTAKMNKQYTVCSITIFAVGILITLMSILNFGFIGDIFRNLLLGVFGVMAYFVGPILVYSGVFISRTRNMSLIVKRMLQILSVFLVVSAIYQLVSLVDVFVYYDNTFERILEIYKLGSNGTGAGLVGLASSFIFDMLFGGIGAIVVLLIILFVLIMIYTGTTLQEFLEKIKKPAESVGEIAKNAYTSSKNKLLDDEKNQKHQNTMPTHPVKSKILHTKKHKIDITINDIANTNNSDIDISLDDEQNKTEQNAEKNIVNNNDYANDNIIEILNSNDKKENDDGVGDYLDGIINKALVNSVEETNFKYHNDEEMVIIEKDIKEKVQKSIDEINNITFNNNDYLQQNIENGHLEEDTLDDILKSVKVNSAVNKNENFSNYDNSEVEPIDFKIKNETTSLFKSENNGETENNLDIERKNKQQNFIKVNVSKKINIDNGYDYPSVNLLDDVQNNYFKNDSDELRKNADKLLETLKSFGVKAKLLEISRGPSVTRYELQPDTGVKISKITGLSDDIALSLASSGIRIEAPIPNKSAIGIEVPNKNIDVVKIKEIINSNEFRNSESKLTVALGKDITGHTVVADLSKMPHLLVAGSTGSGKSVCINSIISSLLFKSSPDDVKLIMIDPKVVELGIYNGIPHLLIPVVTDPKKAAGALSWAVSEMLKRYQLFAEANVRDLKGYNKLMEKTKGESKLPQIVIIIDELADLMMASPRDVEDAICRLAQMARAAGMHLIIATQRPSVDVITGIIKANIPSRIAFSVSSQVDSRTILDSAGAEKLLGRGDMLFYPVGKSKPTRVQGCFVTDDEIERVVDFIKENISTNYDENVIDEIELKVQQSNNNKKGGSVKTNDGDGNFDPMVEKAIQIAVEMGQISTSMLQRKLRLGYARAARVVDELEEMGIVSAMDGSKPRQVLITKEQWIEMSLNKKD